MATSFTKPHWRDISPRLLRGQKPTEPTVMEMNFKSLRITVHRLTYAHRKWFVTCRELGITDVVLQATELPYAKSEALLFIKLRLQTHLATLEEICTQAT